MPNKDSFTFSDKLRKSKSVPLSKRLPSIVGGKNTQKRTLVQRAQRDLPFILVAALALLLLPFLSRTGSDDIPSTGDFAWNTLTDERSFAEGGSSDIMPAGSMQDPLDLILRPRSDIEGSGVTMGTDASKSAYGSGTGSEDGYGTDSYSSRYSKKTGSSSTNPDYNTRKSFDESYTTKTTKKPATTKYGQKTRAKVRQAIVRTPTQLNKDLRISQMHPNRGGASLSHTLPIGQGPNRGSGGGFREGVRPIALQPLVARDGIGRSMTGENLYAEAARSRNAMNAGGPAKANLLAAQMRDVDGKLTPEGPGFGGPGPGASVRPGAGGNGPGNTNGYNIGKPWWWNMMQARSQKMWDLLYYEPRRIWYTNMYNYLSQLMNCLFTGNKDGDVSTMFGKKAGDDDMICEGAAMMSLGDYVEKFGSSQTTKTKEGGSETISDKDGARERWYQDCEKAHGTPTIQEGKRKSFLQTRFECVGLNWGWLKGIFKAKSYGANCSHVNNDPMEFTYSVTKNGKTKQRLENKAVVALVAKLSTDTVKGGEQGHWKEGDKDNYYQLNGQEFVVYAQVGTKLSMSSTDLNNIRNSDICTLTKVIGFVPRADRGAVEKHVDRANVTKLYDDKDKENFTKEYEKQSVPVIDSNGNKVDRYTNKEDKAKDKQENIRINNWAHFRAQVQAAQRICTGKTSYSDVHPLTLNSVYDLADFVSQDGLFNSGVKTNSYKECTIWDKKPEFKKWINNVECTGCGGVGQGCEQPISILENTTFTAHITDSKDKHVYAVLVDQIDQRTKAKLAYVVDYELSDNKNTLRTCDGNDCTYTFNIDAATLGITSGIVDPMSETNNSTRGSGVIFWIVTQGNATFKKHQGDDIADNTHMVDIDDLIESSQSLIHQTCRYRWCHDIANCEAKQQPPHKDYCVEGDNVYIATEVNLNGKKVYVKVEGQGPQQIPATKQMPECTILCYDEDGVHICNKDGEPDPSKPTCPLDEATRKQYGIPPCPHCCTYTDGKNYLSTKLKGQDGKDHLYIIDATPGKCTKSEGDCRVAAWSMEGQDLIVYDMSSYKPECLKLVPGETTEAFKTCTGTGGPGCPKVNLTPFRDPTPFYTIHEQSDEMEPNLDPNKPGIPPYDPQFFELFPQLKIQKAGDIPEIDLTPCNFCGRSDYQNADIRAKDKVIQDISLQVRQCLDRINTLREFIPDLDKYIQDVSFDKLYFYGYASNRGSHRAGLISDAPTIGCSTSGDDRTDGDLYKEYNTGSAAYHWGDCNKALSEDRILYIMDKIIGNENLRPFDIGVDNINKYPDYNGFTNTTPKGLVSDKNGSPKYRFMDNQHPNINNASGDEFIFVSRPCGSDGARHEYNESKAAQAEDRYVLITPVGGKEEWCKPDRMTCPRADKIMQDVVKKLNDKLRELYDVRTDKIKFESTQKVITSYEGSSPTRRSTVSTANVSDDLSNRYNQMVINDQERHSDTDHQIFHQPDDVTDARFGGRNAQSPDISVFEEVFGEID